jgi:membrane fusion protein (multidrug efflux system)
MIDILVSGPGGTEPRRLSFDAVKIKVGRDQDNDVVLDDQSVSRHHAEIVRDRGAYKIVDLGSTNGVRIANARVPEAPIKDGLEAVLGKFTLRFDLSAKSSDQTMLLGSETVMLQLDAAVAKPAAPASKAITPFAEAARPVLHLLLQDGQQRKMLKVVGGVDYVIGRSPESDLVITDSKCSVRHARIHSDAKGLRISDLGSSNGTFVNGEKVESAPLEDGATIAIGAAVITVRADKDDSADDDQLLAKTRIGLPIDALRKPAPAPAAAKPAPGADLDAAAARVPPTKRSVLLLAIFGALGAVAAVAALVVYLLFFRESGGEGEPEVAGDAASSATAQEAIVRVAVATSKPLQLNISASGTLKAHRTSTVSSEIAGRVTNVSVSEGDAVVPGQLLVNIADTDIRLQIDEARRSLTSDQVKVAKDDFERKQRLFERGVITRSVLVASETNYLSLDSTHKALQSRIALLNQQLGKTRIVAQIPGIVVAKRVSEGELVAPGVPVVAIEDMQEMLLEGDVSDRDVVRIQPGHAVEVRTDAFPGRVFAGVIDSVAAAANPITRTFKVSGRVRNSDGSLRSGMIASMRILLDDVAGLVIPKEALIEPSGDTGTVLVVDEGVARRVTVSIGRRTDQELEVLDGLRDGQEVVVYGQDRVRDGATVKVYQEN